MATTTTQEYLTRELPEIEKARLALIKDVQDLTSKKTKNFADYEVADLSQDQRRAAQAARDGLGAYKPYLEDAEGYMSQAGSAKYDPNAVTKFMNPYQQQVTQNALDEMNRQAAMQQAGVSAGAAKAGAFGGSRFGVQQAELGRNLADVQGRQILQDYSQNYSQAQSAAMNAFQNQQARAMSAGTGLASLAQSAQNLNQGDTAFQYNMGEKLQKQTQNIADADRMNQQMRNMEPYQRMSYYADILNKTPGGQMGYSSTSAPDPSFASQATGLAVAGVGAYRAANQWGQY